MKLEWTNFEDCTFINDMMNKQAAFSINNKHCHKCFFEILFIIECKTFYPDPEVTAKCIMINKNQD